MNVNSWGFLYFGLQKCDKNIKIINKSVIKV